ncbi:MAG TPA: hypothetical protein VFA98_11220 [Thermoanaerobaculia bacterium]|jgi:hypothetical protein|nr:hypothetical protein [Thermoanaerobaculia bacterium]
MTSPQIEWRIKDLTNSVLRAARELRNRTQNLVVSEDAGQDARDAWSRLDAALKERDDYIAGGLEKKGKESP